MDALKFPKPVKVPKARHWMRRAKPRRLSRPGSDPGRLEFCRSLNCVGSLFIDGHQCSGPIEAAHDRNMTGLGRKEPDSRTVPMCQRLHRDFDGFRGAFRNWTHTNRRAWIDERVAEVHGAWLGMSDEGRDRWQAAAEEMRRRRAEALRGLG